MKQAVLAHVSIGTDVEHASKIMEDKGFECLTYTNSRFTGDNDTACKGLDFVFFERTDPAGILEVRVWDVALVLVDRKVIEVLVRSGTFGL